MAVILSIAKDLSALRVNSAKNVSEVWSSRMRVMSCHCERSEESAFSGWPIRCSRAVCFFLTVALLAGVLASAFAQKQPPVKPLDLNTATVELATLPGVGPVIAKAIVDFRTKSGPFRRVEDLLAIRGITERPLQELRPYVIVPPARKAAFCAPYGVILCPTQRGATTVLHSGTRLHVPIVWHSHSWLCGGSNA